MKRRSLASFLLHNDSPHYLAVEREECIQEWLVLFSRRMIGVSAEKFEVERVRERERNSGIRAEGRRNALLSWIGHYREDVNQHFYQPEKSDFFRKCIALLRMHNNQKSVPIVFHLVIARPRNGRSNNMQLTSSLFFCSTSPSVDTSDPLSTSHFDFISRYMVFGYVVSRSNSRVAF